MPIRYNGKRVFTVNDYRTTYAARHPDKLPNRRVVKKREPSTSTWSKYSMYAVILAINVMSAAHTVSTIENFYNLPTITVFNLVFNLATLVSFFGFIGVEGTLLVFTSKENQSEQVRNTVKLTFFFALLVNILGSIDGIRHNMDVDFTKGFGWEMLWSAFNIVAAVAVGIIVPAVNVIAGEQNRKDS